MTNSITLSVQTLENYFSQIKTIVSDIKSTKNLILNKKNIRNKFNLINPALSTSDQRLIINKFVSAHTK